MAILRKRTILSSTEPSMRIKQRDYTIPIRLNQPLPADTSSLSLSQVSVTKRRTTNLALINKSKQSNDNINQKKKKSCQLEVSNKMIYPISRKATKRFHLPSVLVVVACVTLTINTDICLCDTKTSLHSSSSSSSSFSNTSPSKNRSPSSSAPALVSAAAVATSSSPATSSSSSTAATSHNKLNQKENLLLALSDKIERQHLKLKPARALIQPRPSKFDSEEYLGELNLDAGLDYIKKKAQPLASIKKVDDSMRQILRMHESSAISAGHQVAAMNPQNKPSLLMPQTPLSPTIASAAIEQVSPVKRWRKITRSPVPLINSLNPNKVVSKMLAYVTPLVSSKFQADANILGPSFSMKNATKLGATKLRPFVARSNNQASLSKSLLSFRPYPTTSPETNSLVKPDSNKFRLNQFSTPSMFINNYNQKSSSSNLKSDSGSSVDSIINDLMADSSDTSITASIEAASVGIPQLPMSSPAVPSSLSSYSSSGGDRYNKKPETTRTAVATITTSSKQPQKSAGSLLKKGANHLAQNYFQNSFRDLLTLSQLPILSTSSTTSTAPSVLEKKRKPNKVDKTGNKFRRRRLIEDLYRYAFLLSTGVRNKRDPLEALGTNPNPLVVAAASTGQKSVLSQRSINQLMAANHNQILNYIRKLRSMLTLSPMNKARPRGVMWDMATDPSLAVTVFHLLERASVALPLGFLLLPVVQMIRHPLNGLNLGRILPAKASHRSVDIEELAKQLDVVDKMLSRALRSTHRESFMGK